MIKPKKLNLISKSDIKNIPAGNLPNGIIYNVNTQKSPFYSYGLITKVDNYLSYKNTTSKLYISNTMPNLKDNNFEFEIKFSFDTLKVDNILFSYGGTYLNLIVKNTYKNGLSIDVANTYFINVNYSFKINTDYVIAITKEDSIFVIYINGISYGYLESVQTNNAIINGNFDTYIGGKSTAGDIAAFNGKLYYFNISFGPTLLHYNSYTKYGDNKLSSLNFHNKSFANEGNNFYCELETVQDSKVTWTYPSLSITDGVLKNNGSAITTNYDNNFTLYTKIFSKRNNANINIINYYNTYKLSVNLIITNLLPEPKVIVNANTKSALDFENGIIDKIGTTVWNKEGTANVTSVNKIFGENSFETKALGDSLYTNSNVITGGSAPFTIEGYYLFRPDFNTTSTGTDLSLFSLCNDSGYYQGYFLSKSSMNIGTYRAPQFSKPILDDSFINKRKIKVNEINKITISYDGSALRSFINDELDGIYGTSVGLEKSSQPLRLMSYNFNTSKNTTSGLIDNINIHDGIATKVRDHDPYEEYLVVDLAFDGENNSTKIVDNALYVNESVSILHFDEKKDNVFIDDFGIVYNIEESVTLNTTDNFFGKSSLQVSCVNNNGVTSTNNKFIFNNGNFTIECFFKVGGGNNNIFYYDGGAVYINEAANAVSLYSSGNRITITGVVLNKWHHIALVRNSGVVYLYLDGKQSSGWSDNRNHDIGYIKIGGSSVGIGEIYLVDEFRVSKGIARYNDTFTPTTEPFNIMESNKWTVNGNAKLNTAQKFNGFSSLYNNQNMGAIKSNAFIGFGFEDFTISFEFIITSYNSFFIRSLDKDYKNGYNIWLSSDKIITLYLFSNGVVGSYILFNGVEINKLYKLSIVCSNKNLKSYINGILQYSYVVNNYPFDHTDITEIFGSIKDQLNNGLNGYIKNFKIYKGVAVIPESPAGKIQLDFDNNVLDKYNNSTWTNNGVTFDQVNSVKGYSAYFNSTYVINSNTNSMDFKNLNFSLEFDSMKKNITTSGVYMFSSNIAHDDSSLEGVWLYKGSSTNNFSYIDYKNKPANITSNINNDYSNVWYNETISRTGGVLLQSKNDVLILTHNLTNQVFNLSKNGFILGKSQWSSANFVGYIDNFKSSKENLFLTNYKPAVHLPLETNATNIGFSALTINSVGSPTYTTIDGKKCIKFESGKYLTINSNNIFNLGTSSDFYIEFDFYPLQLGNRIRLLSNNIGVNDTPRFGVASDNTGYARCFYINDGATDLYTSNSCILDTFNKIIVYRNSNDLYLILNGVLTQYKNYNGSLNFTSNVIFGANPTDASTTYNGYMSNFKMFVGTSEIPETYNDKKVLDLDFKPTRKSYLFKDNNNKCVIHPVNITQRDYQNSQYCCTFNGTDQYLQLGKNDLLNFGNDDFIINIKFKGENGYLLKDNGSNITGISISNKLLSFANNGSYPFNNQTINYIDGNIQNITIVRKGSVLTLYSNEVEIKTSSVGTVVNLNVGDNTFMGTSFNGTIYSIKVLRNTIDLSLLDEPISQTSNKEYTLTNGIESQSIVIDPLVEDDIKFVSSNTNIVATINGNNLVVPKVDTKLNPPEIQLFDGYKGDISKLDMYDIVMTDDDIFIDNNDELQLEYGEVEIVNNDYEFILADPGEFIVQGFIEGVQDLSWSLYNKENDTIIIRGTGDYYYDGLDPLYIDEYEIIDNNTGKHYPINNKNMIRGEVEVIVPVVGCASADFVIKLYRRSDSVLIGIYEIKDELCSIKNLDCNTRYDVMLFDLNTKVESRMMSNRTPIPY